MMRLIRTVLALLVASRAAAAQVPNTDIYLAPLSRVGDSVVVGAAINVTHRPGYDNQTPMPREGRFSVIRVERDSTQRLWSFALDGSDPQLVLSLLKPVGYHAWLDSTRLVTFVLGTPSTLHLVSRDGSLDTVRARDVGRAVHHVPNEPAFTYTQRDSGVLWITRQSIDRADARRLVRAVADNEFHAFMPDGTLLTASGGKLLRWNRVQGEGSAWIPVADLTVNGVRNVTRLAVSPDGNWLAFVAEPAP